jgi:DNA-binding NarL/FixJ family response regulator
MSDCSSPYHVLVVDDEPLLRWSLTQTLRDCGDIVTEAVSGAVAVELLLHTSPPDVVLLAYHVPESFDLELLSTMKRLAPRSQVILMSAHCTPECINQALLCGAYGVVSKPLDMRCVPALVHEAASARPS